MRKIGVISDSHGTFAPEVEAFLAGVDEIWHAGDFGNIETADKIEGFKKLVGVRGNADGGTLRIVYPESQVFSCEGVRVAMTHIGGYPGRYTPLAYSLIMSNRPKIFVDGHSHILKVQWDKANNLLFLNPGACGSYGQHVVRTALRFVIDGDDIRDMEVGEWSR